MPFTLDSDGQWEAEQIQSTLPAWGATAGDLYTTTYKRLRNTEKLHKFSVSQASQQGKNEGSLPA